MQHTAKVGNIGASGPNFRERLQNAKTAQQKAKTVDPSALRAYSEQMSTTKRSKKRWDNTENTLPDSTSSPTPDQREDISMVPTD